MVRFEPTRTRHSGPIRYGTRDTTLYPNAEYVERPDPKVVDVWVAETQDEFVGEAATLGIPVLCESLGPYVVHRVNGVVGAFRPLTWAEVNHYTCAVPKYIESGLSLPKHRPPPFGAWPEDWRPLFYGEPTTDWHKAWVETVGADTGTEVYGRAVYIGHRPDISPHQIAAQGGLPVVDDIEQHCGKEIWPKHGYLVRGLKNHFLRVPPRRLEKIQRAAFNIAWRTTLETDPCCPKP
jgi:hypothetical protein